MWITISGSRLQDERSCDCETVCTVRRYVENTEICRRYFLLHYFDPAQRNRLRCCDNYSFPNPGYSFPNPVNGT